MDIIGEGLGRKFFNVFYKVAFSIIFISFVLIFFTIIANTKTNTNTINTNTKCLNCNLLKKIVYVKKIDEKTEIILEIYR